ncbi:MAG TPA: DUF2892 domain-containing protein [Gemmatimonadales bacterium]|jgi:hypothetical protein
MTKNVGTADVGIRAILAGLLLFWSATLQQRPLVALGIGFVAVVLLGTALFRVCPLYTFLRINTCRSSGAQTHLS